MHSLGAAVSQVVFEIDELTDDPQCVAWLVLANCKQARTWRTALGKLLKADTSWKDDEQYSRLAGNGLKALAHPELGRTSLDNSSDEYDPADSAGPPWRYSFTNLGVVLADEAEAPIGYATFELKWSASQDLADTQELEVEVDEVWLTPERRGEGLSALMAAAVVDGVWRHLALLEETWPSTRAKQPFALVYSGEVYSSSGEAFVKACWQKHLQWLEMALLLGRKGRLVESSVEWDPRW